ncbi:MAG: polysaccharide pyruvyl transferase family protein [Alteraurantiacibacter sp. bin_em_oilr2.035]|nr:polysaccharide pyruvyl transferase family protein [Alteraurantiacibacter sp. bin_em_oilr2.035]
MIKALLLNDTRVDRHHGCTTVIETIDQLCEANGITIVARVAAHSDWRESEDICRKFEEIDLLIVNGEGTIHHDRPAGRALLAAGPYAKRRGKFACLLNSTWQANSAASLKMLEAFDVVTVRESASENELTGHGFAPRMIPDFALYHQPRISAIRTGVGYCDSVEGSKAIALYRRMWELGAVPLPIVRPSLEPLGILRWIKRFDPAMSTLARPTHARDALRATWQDYSEQVGSRDNFTARVAAHELIVTGRFHMMIFALSAQTPILAIGSNTHKIEATLSDAGLEPWRAVSDASLIDQALVDRASRWHSEEQEKLASFVEHGRYAMEALFKDLRSMACND